MNSGCDPDDTRGLPARSTRGWYLGKARWIRMVVVSSLVVVSAICILPYALRVAASAPAVPKTSEASPSKAGKEALTATPFPEAGPAAESGEPYWVQVGAYRDARTAKRVAERLREGKFQVRESVTPRPAPGTESVAASTSTAAQGGRDRYEIVVTGTSAGDVAAKLTAKGLASQSSAEGAVVTPSLFLGEAVALSKDLSDDGLAVRVRRVGATETPDSSSKSRGATEVLHRVRVGGFADRAAALEALKALEARGYKPFLTRGNE
jgi:SPOR domain